MAPPIIPMTTQQHNAIPPMTVPLGVAQVAPVGVPPATVGIAPLGMGPMSTASTVIPSAPLGMIPNTVPAPMGITPAIPSVSVPVGISVAQPISHSLSNGSVAMGHGTAPPRPPPGKWFVFILFKTTMLDQL
jgi:hypothetical protein